MISNKQKSSNGLNWIIVSYLVVVSLLLLGGKITFGHGLGDLFYLFILLLAIVIQVVLIVIINVKPSERNKLRWDLIIAAIFLAIALKITYDFTFGCGPKNSWNGKIFP